MKKKKFTAKKAAKFSNSGYSHGGASLEKNTLKEWFPKSYSPKSDIDMNLSILRDRAVDLATNSPLGAAAINTEITGVLGSGLKIFPQIKFKELGLTPEAAREWSRRTKLEFEMWANSLDCDYLRRNNFYELQKIAFQSYLTDGDSFCLFKRRFTTGNPYTLRLQILPAQRVSNPQTNGETLGLSPVEMELPNGNKVVNGVEVDKQGRMAAIWVCNRIWNEPLSTTAELKWQRVKMFGEHGNRNVLHICYDTRAEMFRGAPFLSPVIETLKQVSRYSDAELTAVIVKSFFSIFFVQPLSNFEFNDILPEEENQLPVDVREYKLGSGTISALPRGVDVKAISRTDGQSNFDAFVSHFVKQIASALNLPYELIVKQFQSSYSASKAALIEAEKEFRQRRAAFVQDFLQPIYENFLIEAVATGRIFAPGFFDDPLKRYCWSNADWRNEQNHSLDPVKEVQGAILKINAGLSTREMEVANLNGTDFWENIEQLKLENEMLKEILPTEKDEETEN